MCSKKRTESDHQARMLWRGAGTSLVPCDSRIVVLEQILEIPPSVTLKKCERISWGIWLEGQGWGVDSRL
jgi:hypothetical protein